jgi:predicted dehydrogenase
MVTFMGGPALLLEQGELRVGMPETKWQLTGTLGTLSFCILPRTQAIVLHEYRNGVVQEETVWEGTENFAMMQERLLADFAEAVASGRPPKTSLEQALVVRELLDAVYESSATGHSVAVRSAARSHPDMPRTTGLSRSGEAEQ